MKRYCYFIFTPLLFISQLLLSQTTSTKRATAVLSGIITDSTGAALPGASITIYDIHRGATSDSLGHYKTAPLAAGRYVVEVSYSGYRTVVQTISLNGFTEQNFTLRPSITEQETVTVTGVSGATSTRRSTQPVVVLKRSQLVGITSTNIINTLTRIPGGKCGNYRPGNFKTIHPGPGL